MASAPFEDLDKKHLDALCISSLQEDFDVGEE